MRCGATDATRLEPEALRLHLATSASASRKAIFASSAATLALWTSRKRSMTASGSCRYASTRAPSLPHISSDSFAILSHRLKLAADTAS